MMSCNDAETKKYCCFNRSSFPCKRVAQPMKTHCKTDKKSFIKDNKMPQNWKKEKEIIIQKGCEPAHRKKQSN
jgi:hypothetical protein